METEKYTPSETEVSAKIEKRPAREIVREWFKILGGAGHVHTELSGTTSAPGEARYSPEQIVKYLEGMVDRGEQKFIDHFVICDHPSSAEIPRPLTGEEAKRLLDQREKINELNREHRVKAVAGVEASFIFEDGRLDLPDEVADKMDLVIASMHGFPDRDEGGQPILDEKGKPVYKKRTPEEKVKLHENVFLAAMENPNIDVIGHPTRHQPLEVLRAIDWDKIFSRAAETGTAIEVNLNEPMVPVWPMDAPKREKYKSDEDYEKALKNYNTHQEYCTLLREIMKKAVACKVKFFVGTDWHTLEQFWQPFRGFTSGEMGLMAKKIRREGRGEKLDPREQEEYDKEIAPKLERLPEAEREMVLKTAQGKLAPEEVKKTDEARLAETPGVRFWMRYARAILELEKAGVRSDDVINVSREKLLTFCQTPKGQR